MLVSMKTVLDKAKREGYGVAAPNVFNMETVRSAFEAARELKAPVIIDGAEVHGIESIAAITRYYSSLYPEVVAALNLDHGRTFDVAIKAIRSGFTSVMVDRSTLTFDENVAQVKEIVRIAHIVGVSVEAELGHVGQGYEYESTRNAGLTNPDEAVEFVKQTGIDMLAVAVGTSHGTYKGTPYLDFKLLEKLASIIDVPLVLHGGSGTGDENLRKAVEKGIQKVNLFTDLSNAGMDTLKFFINNDGASLEDISFETGKVEKKKVDIFNTFEAGAKGYKQKLMHYMRLFGSEGKAI